MEKASASLSNPCNMRASVTTGLEFLAARELGEKVACTCVEEHQGAITWKQDFASCTEALKLRTVEKLEVSMSKFEIEFAQETDKAILQLTDLVTSIDWQTGLNVWSRFSDFPHTVSAKPMQQVDHGNIDITVLPSYRATCVRTGQNHCFSSQDVAHKVGGKINDVFGWRVDLKNFDIEVVIHIVDNKVSFGILLTKESLFKRNITNFARSTLKSTISAAMLKLAEVAPGETVVDPMCGSGSITVEGALEYPQSFHMAGDNQEYCVECCRSNIVELNNIQAQNSRPVLNASVMLWDATNLPLFTASVDAIVTDMPFGKRHGNATDNRKLYPSFLTEAARVTTPDTGRAVLLTADRKCMHKILPQLRQWWAVPRTGFINHGGLRAGLYLLKRTAKVW